MRISYLGWLYHLVWVFLIGLLSYSHSNIFEEFFFLIGIFFGSTISIVILIQFIDYFLDRNIEKFSNYKNLFSEYIINEEFNKHLLKEHKDQLQYYKNHEKSILENYQNELKKYEDNQDDIKMLKEEIGTLYQFLDN